MKKICISKNIRGVYYTRSLSDLSKTLKIPSDKLIGIYKQAVFPMKLDPSKREWWLTDSQFKTALTNIPLYLNKSK